MSEEDERYRLLHPDKKQLSINANRIYQRGSTGRQRVYENYARPVLAELVGTMLFVCVGVLCVIQASTRQGIVTCGSIGIAVGQGLTFALLVAAFADVSGNYQTDYGGSGRVYEDYVRPVVAELVGTMLFVCGGVLCVFQLGQGDSTSGSISVAVGQGLMIVELVIAFGDISGGHFNPAVTMGALLAGAITPGKALLYVFGQLAGGLAGAGLSRGILPTNAYKTIGGGAHTLPPEVTVGEGMLCEVVLTAVLVLTAIVTAMDPRTKSCLAPVAIGFAVTVDVLAGMFISGASMNPARSFGPAVVVSSFTNDFWKYHYIYWVGPFLGSLASGVCYRFLLASPEKRLIFKD